MCQSLVDRMAGSRQLAAVAHPEVLALFENWLDELEHEVASFAAGHGADPAAVAEGLGLSRSGAVFILAKLRQEGRL